METLKTLKTSFLSQLLTISDEHTICAKFIKVKVICHEGFLGLCFSLSSSHWFEVGGTWKRDDVTYLHAPIRILRHLNPNVMTDVGVFADVSRPLSIKSHQTTPTIS